MNNIRIELLGLLLDSKPNLSKNKFDSISKFRQAQYINKKEFNECIEYLQSESVQFNESELLNLFALFEGKLVHTGSSLRYDIYKIIKVKKILEG